MEIMELLKKHPIIPVVVFHELNDVMPIAEALKLGGIHIVEVTLRTPIALEAIRRVRQECPELVVGAGTVITPDQMSKVKEVDAHFAVSPGLTGELAEAARQVKIPYLPAAITPSEVMVAQEMGYQCLKFFPAECVGGIGVLKAFLSVFPDVVFCATGGVDRSNFKEYLALKNVISVGGSWLIPTHAVQKKAWGMIQSEVKASLEDLR